MKLSLSEQACELHSLLSSDSFLSTNNGEKKCITLLLHSWRQTLCWDRALQCRLDSESCYHRRRYFNTIQRNNTLDLLSRGVHKLHLMTLKKIQLYSIASNNINGNHKVKNKAHVNTVSCLTLCMYLHCMFPSHLLCAFIFLIWTLGFTVFYSCVQSQPHLSARETQMFWGCQLKLPLIFLCAAKNGNASDVFFIYLFFCGITHAKWFRISNEAKEPVGFDCCFHSQTSCQRSGLDLRGRPDYVTALEPFINETHDPRDSGSLVPTSHFVCERKTLCGSSAENHCAFCYLRQWRNSQ